MKKLLPLLVPVILVLAGTGYYFLSKPVPVTDPTAWKTYENKKFGFSIQYPPDFTLTERAIDEDMYLEVGISDPATRAAYISITVWGKQSNLDEANEFFVGPYPKEIPPAGNNSSITVVERTLNGLTGIERYGYGGEGTSFDDIFMYKNTYLWAVSLDGVMEGRITEEREPGAPVPEKAVYDRILSSIHISSQ